MNESEFTGYPENSKHLYSGKIIASGGTADLFLQTIGNRYYIRKVLKEPYRTDPRFVDLLQREFEIAQSFDHPNIIRYLYLDTTVFPAECILEYCDGVSPIAYFQNKKTMASSLHSYSRLLKELSAALRYLKLKNTVHSDIKPSNLLINNDGQLKILDFGHARTSNVKTLSGGSPGYGLNVGLNPDAEACRNTLLEIKKSARYLPAIFKFNPLRAQSELGVIQREIQFVWSIVCIPIVMLFVGSICLMMRWDYDQIKSNKLFIHTKSITNKSAAKTRTKTNKVYDSNKVKSLSKNKKSDTDFEAGLFFWRILENKMTATTSYSEFRNERLRIIDSCFMEWKKSIIRSGIEEGTTEYQHRYNAYQSGYFKAYLESESALKKLK